MGRKTDQLREDKCHPYIRQLTDEGATQPLEVEKSSGSPRTLTERRGPPIVSTLFGTMNSELQIVIYSGPENAITVYPPSKCHLERFLLPGSLG